MPHVISLTTNFCSPDGQPHTFALGRLTLVKGRNGAGKSSIISTPLRLALSGSTDDVRGKDDVRDSQVLAQFMPRGADELFAHVTLDDGGQGAWGTARTPEGGVKRPLLEPPPGVDPDRALPLRMVRAALAGEEQAARRTFLSWVGQPATAEDVLALIPSHAHPTYLDVAEKVGGTPTERLAAVAEYARRRAHDIEAEAAAQDALIEGMSQHLGTARPAEQDVLNTRALVDQWGAALAAALAWEARPRGDVAEREEDVRAAEEAVRGWEAAVSTRRGSAPTGILVDHRHARAVEVLDAAACASGTCFACGAQPGAEALRAWAAHHRSAAAGSPAERARVDAEMGAHHTALSAEERALSQWREVLDHRRDMLSRAVGVVEASPVDPGVTVEAARSGQRAAQEALGAAERAASAWETVNRARDAAAALRADRPAYQDLQRYCMTAVTDLLGRSSAAFCESVQAYLPARWRVAMRLREGDREVFRIGFADGDHLRTNLSGSERDALCVAVAMAVAGAGGAPPAKKGGKRVQSRVAGTYALAIPEDRDRDGEVLADLMRAWAKFPGQVVIESTELPRGRFPAEWTLLDMDDWRAKFRTAPLPEPREEPKVENGAAGALTPPPPPPTGKWYYHAGSDSYTRVPDEEWSKLDPLTAGQLAEIEGTDDAAPDRHRAQQDDPRNAPAIETAKEPPTVLPAPSPEAILYGLGFSEALVTKMQAETRRYLIEHSVIADDTIRMGQSLVVRDQGKKSKVVKALALDE